MDGIIGEGFTLLVFGMGFVIVFLTLLVIATTYMSRILMRFEPVPVPIVPKNKQLSATTNRQANDPALVAVMSAAIKKYREDRNGQ